jgi:hypothetical protein
MPFELQVLKNWKGIYYLWLDILIQAEVGEWSKTKEIEKKNPCFVCETKGGGSHKATSANQEKNKKSQHVSKWAVVPRG